MEPPPPPPRDRFRVRVKIFPPSSVHDLAVKPNFIMTLARGPNLALPDLTMQKLCEEVLRRFKELYPNEPLFKIHQSQDEDRSDLFLEDRVGDLFVDNEVFRVVQGSSIRDSVQPVALAAHDGFTQSQRGDSVIQVSSTFRGTKAQIPVIKETSSPSGKKRKYADPDRIVPSREKDTLPIGETRSHSHHSHEISIPETQPTEVEESDVGGDHDHQAYILNRSIQGGSPILGRHSMTENVSTRIEPVRRRFTALNHFLEHTNKSAWDDNNSQRQRSIDLPKAPEKSFRDSALPSSNGDIHEEEATRNPTSSDRIMEALLPSINTVTPYSKKLRRPSSRARNSKPEPPLKSYDIEESESAGWDSQIKRRKIVPTNVSANATTHPSKRFAPNSKVPYPQEKETLDSPVAEFDNSTQPNMTQDLQDHIQMEHDKEMRSQEQQRGFDSDYAEERAERIMAGMVAAEKKDAHAPKRAGEAALRRQEQEKAAAKAEEQRLAIIFQQNEEDARAKARAASEERQQSIQRRHDEELQKSKAAQVAKKRRGAQTASKDMIDKTADTRKKEVAAQKARESADRHAKKEAVQLELEKAARKPREPNEKQQIETPIFPPPTISSAKKFTPSSETRKASSSTALSSRQFESTPTSLHSSESLNFRPKEAPLQNRPVETPIPAPRSILRTPTVETWSNSKTRSTPKRPSTPVATSSSKLRSSSQESRSSLQQTTLAMSSSQVKNLFKKSPAVPLQSKPLTPRIQSQQSPVFVVTKAIVNSAEKGQDAGTLVISSDSEPDDDSDLGSKYTSNDSQGSASPDFERVSPPLFNLKELSAEPPVNHGLKSSISSQKTTSSTRSSQISQSSSQRSRNNQSAGPASIVMEAARSGSITPRQKTMLSDPTTPNDRKSKTSPKTTDTETDTQAQLDSQLMSSSQQSAAALRGQIPSRVSALAKNPQRQEKLISVMSERVRQERVKNLRVSQQNSIDELQRQQEIEDGEEVIESSSEEESASSTSNDSDSEDIEAKSPSQEEIIMNAIRKEFSDDIAKLGSSPSSLDFPLQIGSSSAKKKAKSKTDFGRLRGEFSIKNKGKKSAIARRPSNSMRGL